MRKGSETSTWFQLKKELDRLRWTYQRLELKAMLGVPDVNVHVPGVGDMWLELKFVRTLPASGQVNVGLRREQYNWMFENQKAGRSIALVAKVEDSWYVWSIREAWELAKSTTSWANLSDLGQRFTSAAEVCRSLSNCA